MSLEQLVEEDMGRFLESEVRTESKKPITRVEELYPVTRDWESEVRLQLKRNNLLAAKGVFNELKQHYEEVPRAHAAERARTYETLQACYLAIITAAHEHARTQALLRRLDQMQDDVFDVQVKPIDLQSQREAPSFNEAEHAAAQSLAQTQDLSLPAPPEGAAVKPLPSMPGAQPSAAAAVADFKQRCAKIVETAKRDPAEAQELIAEAKAALEKAPLPTERREQMLVKLHNLERAVGVYDEKLRFEQEFTTALQEIKEAMPDEAVELKRRLYGKAEEFESTHPEYEGVFTGRLQRPEPKEKPIIQPPRPKVSEDDIVDALTPTFIKLKASMVKRDEKQFHEALADLERFTATLPQGEHRELLARAAIILRAKAQRARIGTLLGPVLQELHAAKASKDVARMRAAVKRLAEVAAQLPPSSERSMLEQTLQQLRAKGVAA